MSFDPHPGSDDSELERALRSMFGDQTDMILEQLRAAGFDPEQLAAGMGDLNPQMMQAAMRQFQEFFDTDSDEAVNTSISHDIARQVTAAAGADPVVSDLERKSVADAYRVAELWLDVATDFAPVDKPVRAWSRAEWVEATIGTWNALTEPVAQAVVDALVELLSEELGHEGALSMEMIDPAQFSLPEGLSVDDLLGGAGQDGVTRFSADDMLRRIGAAVFGMQVGQATGELASEVFGTTDVGVPLLDSDGAALVARNVRAFAEGLDIEERDVLQFLALREAAAVRLFTAVPWLRAHVLGLIDDYARGVRIDTDALEEKLRDIDPMNTDQLRHALSQGVFSVTSTPEQQATLQRLETALALIEGWVDAVSFDASRAHLTTVVPLREMMRRRRAAGGPAEQTFATLVGLELRPRRAREATALWESLQLRVGTEERDKVWAHPDLLPSGADLDNAEGFVARWQKGGESTDDVDAALNAIFDAAETDDSDD